MKAFEKETITAQLKDEQKALKDLEKAYKKAKKDCQEKIRQLNARKDMQNLQSIVHQKKYQKALMKQIDGVLNDLQTNTHKSANEFFQGSYQNGYVGSMYELMNQGIPLTVPVNTKKMMTAVQTNSKLSTNYYLKQGLTVQNIRTLKKQIAMEMTRGIGSGRSWLDVADSLTIQRHFQISQSDAMRIVRTEGNRINQQGRLDAGDEAINSGCDLLKQWDATLDSKTRPAHREADGQIVEWNEKFTVMGEKLDAPSIGGSASNVCNCRCQLLKRPRWALDDDELEVLKQRASYYGLDKSKSFEDYKNKFLKIPSNGNSAETIESMNQRLEQMKNEKLQAEKDLRDVSIKKSVGDYREKKVEDLNSIYSDVYNLTDDDLKRLKKLDDNKEHYTAEWQRIQDELSNIRSTRPRMDDFIDEKDYDDAFEKYLLRKKSLQEQVQHYSKLSSEAYDASTKLARYKNYQNYLKKTEKYKTLDELRKERQTLMKKIKGLGGSITDLEKKIKSHPDYMNIYKSPILKSLERTSIERMPVTRRTKQITEEEIIKRLAGGDQTQGSCASLSLAYMGQKDGINVLDFRDGKSREFFSSKGGWMIEKIEGVRSFKSDMTKTQCSTCYDMMSKHMEVGKEYNLVTGCHSAMVRLNKSGNYEYLELQSGRKNGNGWKSMGSTKKDVTDMLNWRFRATKKSKYSSASYLYDADSVKGNKDFEKILEYINTAEEKQVKGRSGSIK